MMAKVFFFDAFSKKTHMLMPLRVFYELFLSDIKAKIFMKSRFPDGFLDAPSAAPQVIFSFQ